MKILANLIIPTQLQFDTMILRFSNIQRIKSSSAIEDVVLGVIKISLRFSSNKSSVNDNLFHRPISIPKFCLVDFFSQVEPRLAIEPSV